MNQSPFVLSGMVGKTIKGQRDVWVVHTPLDTETVTIDYTAGNSHIIDISLLDSTDSITITTSKWPAYATYHGLMSLDVFTGADPDVTITDSLGLLAGAALVASKQNKYTIDRTWDDGTYISTSVGDF
jgi:hypothetical protein